MSEISSYINDLKRPELLSLCESVNLNLKNKTVPKIKKELISFFKKNPGRLNDIPEFSVLTTSSKLGYDADMPKKKEESQDNSNPEDDELYPKVKVNIPNSEPVISATNLAYIFQNLADTLANTMKPPNKSNLHQALQEFSRRKISFSGEKDENPELFLKSFTKVCSLFDFSVDDKVRIFPELLKGRAALWFASIPGGKVWPELESEFKKVYFQYVSDTQNVINLLQRSQAYGEDINHYLASVHRLNSRLKQPYSSSDLLKIVIENLHPDYVDIIEEKQPTNFEELKEEARLYELRKLKKKSYQPPPSRLLHDQEFGDISIKTQVNQNCKSQNKRPTTSAVEAIMKQLPSISELEGEQYQSTSSSVNQIKYIPTSSAATTTTKTQSTYTQTGVSHSLFCWNCNKAAGHTYQHCREPRRVFCYHCGKPNVYSPDCDCNTHKNEHRNKLSEN